MTDWNPKDAFFQTAYGKQLLKKALDKDQYWGKDKQGPSQDEVKVAHPGGGTTTQVSNPGKGGEGVYDVKKTDIKAKGPYADAHVETLTEAHEAFDDVALKEPKGVQGGNVQKFTKKAEDKEEAHKKIDEAEVALEKAEDELGVQESPEHEMEEHVEKKTSTLLEKLVKIANDLDEKGLTEEANMIDAIVQEEAANIKTADSDRKKYVSEEGHFKGKEGSGERWDNCIKYQKSQGHSQESAEKICGYIKSRKGS